ncbi:MAG: hypothetical protein GKR94_25495 [Gammaproteobacteria bacterium]|nr:hypothetical protein [Gammaproteobacteria bacterium]
MSMPFGVDAFTPDLPGPENVQRVVKEAGERRPVVFGGTWHTDSAFLSLSALDECAQCRLCTTRLMTTMVSGAGCFALPSRARSRINIRS